MFGGDPSLELEDFLIPFTTTKPEDLKGKESEEDRKKRISQTKNMFATAMSIAAVAGAGKGKKQTGKKTGKQKGERLPRQNKDKK